MPNVPARAPTQGRHCRGAEDHKAEPRVTRRCAGPEGPFTMDRKANRSGVQVPLRPLLGRLHAAEAVVLSVETEEKGSAPALVDSLTCPTVRLPLLV